MSTDINYTDVGERIRKARKEQGLTQEQLAEVVGVGSEHISRIENAKRHASVSVLMSISDKLGLDPLEMLYGIRTDRDNYLIPEMLRVVYRLEHLDRRKALHYMEGLELAAGDDG